MRILLTGNLFHNYEFDFKEALEQMGHQVDLCFNNIHGPFSVQDVKTIPSWLKYGLLPYKFKIHYFFNRSVQQYNNQLQQMIRKNRYDLLLTIGGKTIEPETLQLFRGKKILWFLDSITRYEEVFRKVPFFDSIFLFEPTDIDAIRKRYNRESYFLATAFNPRIYFPQQLKQQYDFSFVGSYYPVREEFLSRLYSISNNVCIYGDFYRAAFKPVRDSVKKVNVPRERTNHLFNTTRVNINIHHNQSKEGLSPRTFEILGAGGFQMVEGQKVAMEYFRDNQDICFYSSKEEFDDKARFYLQHDTAREKIARNGYQTALNGHTWKHRLQEMLQLSPVQ